MRLLIVSYYFAPHPRAGATRPTALANALARLGHEVVVVTAQEHPECDARITVITIPDRRLGSRVAEGARGGPTKAGHREETPQVASVAARAALKLAHGMLWYPDKYSGWLRRCVRWVRANPSALLGMTAVIASHPPISAAFAGLRIAEVTGAPLIVEMRDLWTANLYYPFGRLRCAIDRVAEHRLVTRAVALVVPTRRFQEILGESYPEKTTRLIYTGLPRSELPLAEGDVAPSVPRTLTIVHAGNTYGGKRDLRPLLLAVRALADRGRLALDRVRIEMYGEVDAVAVADTQRLRLDGVVRLAGSVPRDVASRAIRSADVALVLMWDHDTDALPVKAVEYLAAGKEILVIGAPPRSEVRDALTGLDGVRFADNRPEIEEALLAAVAGVGARGPRIYPPDRAARFGDDRMAQEYVGLIEEVAQARSEQSARLV